MKAPARRRHRGSSLEQLVVGVNDVGIADDQIEWFISRPELTIPETLAALQLIRLTSEFKRISPPSSTNNFTSA